MKNKTIAKMIIGSIVLTLLTSVFESSLAYETADNLYALAGLSMMIFGIWGSVRLLKSEQ